MAGRKPKVTPELISIASELSKAGFSDKQIYESLDISHTAFYKNVELISTVKNERQELRKVVSDALLNTAVGGDTTALIFLSKRLGLFQSTYKKGQLKTSADAAVELERLYHAAGDGVPTELINSLSKVLNDFTKTLEVGELEKRIIALEKEAENESI